MAQYDFISAEAAELIATRAYYHDGLRKLGTLLPPDDAELVRWLSTTGAAQDENFFKMLLAAAALAGRKLPASLLPVMLLMQVSAWHVASIAWRMEGNVTEELLRGLEAAIVNKETQAMALLMAALWWQEHRAGEELPRTVLHGAKQLAEEENLEAMTIVLLQDIGILLGDTKLARLPQKGKQPLTPALERKQIDKFMAILRRPFETLIHERETHEYQGTEPVRRAVKEVGRNEQCPCGSGKKYKKCCEKADLGRLRRSSAVPGVTKDEIMADPNIALTEAGLSTMRPSQILQIDPERVPKDLQQQFVLSLVVAKHYDEAIAALRKLGVPEHLREVWSYMFEYAGQAWRPDIARALLELLPDAEDIFGVKANAGIRLLLVGDDPAKLLETLEAELRAGLESGDLEETQRLAWVVIESPYRALGIFLLRSLLQIAEPKYVPGLFDAILEARAKLNLSPDDEFSDFMDARTLKDQDRDESAEAEDAQAELQSKAEEIRQLKEARTADNRKIGLLEKRAREATAQTPQSPADAEEMRALRDKIRKKDGLLKEWGAERVQLRHKVEVLEAEAEKSAAETVKSPPEPEEDSEAGEEMEVSTNQPVRLIEFPDKFGERLAGFKPHVGRAALNFLGRIASGEKSAFAGVCPLKAYPSVLRKRLAGHHRLFFSLHPDRVQVVDLIARRDLDRRIKQLQASGH